MTLPPFTEDGLLPPGTYTMTLDGLRTSLLVKGPDDGRPWDREWRAQLVENLAELLPDPWNEGVSEVYVDGSFVTAKARPGDIDGYYVVSRRDFPRLAMRLARRNPVWDWVHRPIDPQTGKAALAMWHRYRVEIYPHLGQAAARDQFGQELTFPSWFRQTRDGRRKGIIEIPRPRT